MEQNKKDGKGRSTLGRIKESGTHDSLMAANGTYAHLVELQAS